MPDFLDKKLEKLVKRANNDSEKDEVRFSLTLSRFNNRRVEYLRHSLKLSKQQLLEELIVASISQLEIKMGLSEFNDTHGEVCLNDDYTEKILSKKPIVSMFREKK